jgi:hypothetical protein
MLTYLEKGWVEGQTAAVEAYAFRCLIMRKGQAQTVILNCFIVYIYGT